MKFKILVSYAYFANQDLSHYVKLAEDAGNEVQFFVDSGAVTAQSLGWTISLDEYISWLKENKRHVHVYANLDVIGDPKGTHDNQTYMESKGMKPIPVYHRGEPWSVLEHLTENYRYLGVGGAVPDSKTNQELQLGRWLVGVFRRTLDRNVAVHGFGITRQKLLNSFPFYSVDASSWQLGAQYGALRIWDRREGRMKVINQHQHSLLNHTDLIRDYGEDPVKLAGGREDGYHYSQALRVGIHSFRGYEMWLKQRHGPIRLARKPSGLHLYAATASTNHVEYLLRLPPSSEPVWLKGYE